MRLRGRLAGWTQTPPRPASKATSPTKPYWNDSPPYLMEIHFSKESKMDDNDFSDWKLCWQVNLLFHEPVTNIQKCIICSGVHDYTNYARRSTFWLDITRCTTGHRQATQVEVQGTPSLGVCAICDQMYLFDIVNGKYKCRREGCRRIVRVHEGELRQRLAHDNVLLNNFLFLLQKHRFYECFVCLDKVEYGSNPTQSLSGPTPDCDHDRNICDACLTNSFESSIWKSDPDLLCLDCKKPIPLGAIRSNVSAEAFKHYNKLFVLKIMKKNRNFRWCSCGHGQIHGPGETNPEWVCLRCSKEHCFICKEDSSMDCEHLRAIKVQKRANENNQKQAAIRIFSDSAQRAEEAQQRVRENVDATKREIARITKVCPKAGCCNRIQRSFGCGHFTCKLCKTEFCWSCKVIWKDKKALHLVGCVSKKSGQVDKRSLDQTGYATGWDKDEGYDLSLDKVLRHYV